MKIKIIRGFKMIIYMVLCYAVRIKATKSNFYDVNYDVHVVETCNGEQFTVDCGENKVAILLSARYGRIGYGRCITAVTVEEEILTNKTLGCFADVLSYLNNIFSNSYQNITYHVSELDPMFSHEAKCGKDLKLHLNASYQCIPVLNPSSNCHYDITSNPVYISSNIGSCGSPEKSWFVKVSNGKTIKLTILWFKNDNTDKLIGSVKDVKENSIDLKSHSSSYEINSSEVRIFLKRSLDKFLVKLEDMGCSDMKLPQYYTVMRSGIQSIVKCINSNEQWIIVCENGTWSGRYDKCTAKTVHPESGILSIVLGISVVIVVCVIVSCLSLNLFLRHQAKSSQMAISNATYGPGLGLGQIAQIETDRKTLNGEVFKSSQPRIYCTNYQNRFAEQHGTDRNVPMNFNSSFGSIPRLDSQRSIYSLQYDKFRPSENFSTVRIPRSQSQHPCLSKAFSISAKGRKKARTPGYYQLHQQQKQHQQQTLDAIHATGSVPQFPVSGEDHLPHWSCSGFYNHCDCSSENVYNLPEGSYNFDRNENIYPLPCDSGENPQCYHSIPQASVNNGFHIEEACVSRSNETSSLPDKTENGPHI